MTRPPRIEQTGIFRISDGVVSVEVKEFTRFIDVSNMRSTRVEWSANHRKRYYDFEGRGGEFKEGSHEQFFFLDEPQHLFTKES